MSVRLRFLGGLAVERGDSVQQLTLERPVSLLVYLALRRDWVSRIELALLYRPDARADAALRYVRTLVHRARSQPWATELELEADRVRWLVASDVFDFRQAVRGQDWGRAIDLYAGTFLNGTTLTEAPGFESWQELEQSDLHTAWAQASQSQAGSLQSRGRHGDAALVLQPLVTADPLDEATLQQYLRALAADGRNREALSAFERFEQTLAEEVGGQPLESTLLLADSLRESPVSELPRSEPPVPSTSFVGRSQELEVLKELLENDSVRLVTIVGLGGSGKTRLALEAVSRHRRAQAVYVPLAAITAAGRVAQAILEALGQHGDDVDAERNLLAQLRNSSDLLLLDNFEQVLEAAPLLIRLLAGAPGLKIVVTSRESLQVSGEFTLEVAGLAGTGGDASGADVTDAAQLFIARAARYGQRFSAAGQVLESINDICAQVDGLPLAIEIAAGWTKILPVQELARQLADHDSLLESDLRDLPERHRSIRAILGHTWQGLSEAERQAMTRLAVFDGGFTLAAARAAGSVDLDLLLSLLDRSLVRRYGQDRFVLHGLLRQYTHRNAEDSELAAARDAHRSYHCALLGQIAHDLKGANVPLGLERVQADRANFEAAWNHAVQTLDLTALDQARDALDYYLYYRTRFQAAREHFESAASALEPLSRTDPAAGRLRGCLLAQLAEKEFNLGEHESAFGHAREATALLAELGSDIDLANARLVLANGLVRSSEFADARDTFTAVLETALATGELYLEGAARNGLGTLYCTADGDIASGEEQYRASLRAHRRVGNLEGVTGALTNLGACRFDLHDHAEAERLWTEAAAMCRELGFTHREAALLNNLGALAESRGEFGRARELLERSLAVRRDLGYLTGIASVLGSLGRLALQESDAASARERLQDALEIYEQISDQSGAAHTRSQLARALLLQERHTDAARQVAIAIETSLDIGSHADLLGSLLSGALVLDAQGDAERAASLAGLVAERAQGNKEPLRRSALELLKRSSHEPGQTGNLPPTEQYARQALNWFTAATLS